MDQVLDLIGINDEQYEDYLLYLVVTNSNWPLDWSWLCALGLTNAGGGAGQTLMEDGGLGRPLEIPRFPMRK